jgi:electron transport complex protein RnfC
MKLFRFKGGVHPEEHKTTQQLPIKKLPLPSHLYLPLQQHIGAPAKPLVAVGERVLKGQLIAAAVGVVSAPVHASSSGTVVAIDDVTAPHPSGLPIKSIIIATDGLEQWCESVALLDPFQLTPTEVAQRVGEAGIVGMGGAAFPAAVKLNLGSSRTIHTLVINGGECEPYLTCDDRLMQERPGQIIDGVLLMLHALQTGRALIAIENNKPLAQQQLSAAARDFPNIEIVGVPTRYPMGSEKQMIQTLTGLEVPAGGLGADIGVVVHNVATAFAVHDALRHQRPLISRIVTVSGEMIREPANLEVPIGTAAEELVTYCGGFNDNPHRLLMGGPMMGMALPHLKIPVVKGSNGLLALSREELGQQQASSACIRCGRCVDACPLGLLPLEMAARARNGRFDEAVDFGLYDCIACGTCAYVCPAAIPLTQYFNYARGELTLRRSEKQKAERTRELAKARQQRVEREAQEKHEAMMRRKAERDARKKAEAEAAAAAAAEEAAAEATPEASGNEEESV